MANTPGRSTRSTHVVPSGPFINSRSSSSSSNSSSSSSRIGGGGNTVGNGHGSTASASGTGARATYFNPGSDLGSAAKKRKMGKGGFNVVGTNSATSSEVSGLLGLLPGVASNVGGQLKGLSNNNALGDAQNLSKSNWFQALRKGLAELNQRANRTWVIIDTRAFNNNKFVLCGYNSHHDWQHHEAIHVTVDFSRKQVLYVTAGSLQIVVEREQRPKANGHPGILVEYIRTIDAYKLCPGRGLESDQKHLAETVAGCYVGPKSKSEINCLKNYPTVQPVVCAKVSSKTYEPLYTIERLHFDSLLVLRSRKCHVIHKGKNACGECLLAHRSAQRIWSKQPAGPKGLGDSDRENDGYMDTETSDEAHRFKLIDYHSDPASRGMVPLGLTNEVIAKLKSNCKRAAASFEKTEKNLKFKLEAEKTKRLSASSIHFMSLSSFDATLQKIISAFQIDGMQVDFDTVTELWKDQIKIYQLIEAASKQGVPVMRKLSGMRWSEATLEFCLQWQTQFGKAGLEGMRQLFILPSIRSLRVKETKKRNALAAKMVAAQNEVDLDDVGAGLMNQDIDQQDALLNIEPGLQAHQQELVEQQQQTRDRIQQLKDFPALRKNTRKTRVNNLQQPRQEQEQMQHQHQVNQHQQVDIQLQMQHTQHTQHQGQLQQAEQHQQALQASQGMLPADLHSAERELEELNRQQRELLELQQKEQEELIQQQQAEEQMLLQQQHEGK